MRHYWRIGLLGGLRAAWVGPPLVTEPRVVERFPTRKTALLLAYLALHPRPHSREALIDLCWPDSDLDAGRQSLSRALSSLRHVLEPPGVVGGCVIVTDRTSVSLRPDAVTSDVAAFQAALQRPSSS